MNLAVFGGSEQMLRSVPQDGEQYIAALGGIKVDLSQLDLPETLRLSALAFMGGVEMIVPRGTDVVMSGFSLFGGREYKVRRDYPATETRTVIYLNAVAVLGGITVKEAKE